MKRPNNKAIEIYKNLLYKTRKADEDFGVEKWSWQNTPIEGEKESRQLIRNLEILHIQKLKSNEADKKMGIKPFYSDRILSIVGKHILDRIKVMEEVYGK